MMNLKSTKKNIKGKQKNLGTVYSEYNTLSVAKLKMFKRNFVLYSVTLWMLLLIIVCLLMQHSMLPQIKLTVVYGKSMAEITRRKKLEYYLNETKPVNFEKFDNHFGNPDGCYIIPNIVHFIRFTSEPISYTDMICYLAALKNQKPDLLLIHHDGTANFSGKYWETIENNPEFDDVIELRYMEKPHEIFGRTIDKSWGEEYVNDIARLLILMEYGGFFLDKDVYLVRALDNFRRYEFVVGMNGRHIDNRVLIAHKTARLLPLWLGVYNADINQHERFLNSIVRPTELINSHLEMVHIVKHDLKMEKGHDIFTINVCWKEWCDWPYVLYVNYSNQLERWNFIKNKMNKSDMIWNFPEYNNIDESNVVLYNNAFRDMALHIHNPTRFTLLSYCYKYY
ncbi:uncharacterized protein LOC142328030 [Lycorma delicatula]|uniref:uncharacterized protein LOC142328030 n=1 Tax=Lycorma delicatula TaxID=130591 RepID=UPI003F5166D0